MNLHRLLLPGLLAACFLHADTVWLDVGGGALVANPGDLTGWGFTLTWTPTGGDWVSVTGSTLINETNPALGVFTDFIGAQGGPDPFFALGPTSNPWTENFDPVNSLGLGSYAVDPAAVPFAVDSGQIQVFFDIFDGQPGAGGNQIGSDSVTANFSVQVAGSAGNVPEPSNLWMAGVGVVALGLGRLRIRCRRRSIVTSGDRSARSGCVL